MDFLFELLFEIYGELMLLIVPEKGKSKRYRVLAKIIAVLMLLGVVALVFLGIFLIVDRQNLAGIAPLTVAVLISLAQIVAGIILFKRNHGGD
ncbi:MAG: hypothetical protein J6V07_00590 [Clostridia bacterium]|nr:hypothetical protein [Clostridia bacterium]